MSNFNEALETFHRGDLEYAGGLANHGPMGAEALERLQQPRIIHPAPEDVARLESLSRAARRRLALPLATERVVSVLPGSGAAPYTTSAMELVGREDGGFDAHLALSFSELAGDLEQVVLVQQ